MPPIPLTRVATLAPFPRILAAGGFEVVRAMERAGLAPELLQSPETFVPLQRAATFVDQVARHEGIGSLGFVVGDMATLGELGNFGRIIGRSLTVRDMLRRFVRFVPLVNTGARAWVEDVPERQAVRLCLCHQLDVGRELVDGYALLVLINATRQGTGADWFPEHVRINNRLADPGRVRALSGARVESGRDHCAFEIPKDLLPRRFGRRPSAPNGQAASWSKPPATFVATLVEAIRSGFGSRMVDTVEASELAGMSVRTLQRQLKKEGYQFRDLVDEVRFDEACALLADRSVPIAGIGRHLGYPDGANFTHAFRRWTGESPSAWRERITG